MLSSYKKSTDLSYEFVKNYCAQFSYQSISVQIATHHDLVHFVHHFAHTKEKIWLPSTHGNVTNYFLIHYPPCIKRILYKELYIISLISFPSPISLIWFSWTNFIQWHFARVFINSKENEIQIAEKRKSTETFFKMRCFPTNSLECIIFKTIP